MTPINRTDNEARSADVIAQNIEVLKGLFPEAVSEGKLDLSVLKGLIGIALLPDEEREEKYGLNWFGKRKARQIALTPSTGTLRPCKEDSVDWDTTKNLMIEGDNLEVLKLLQKSYAGQVKLIYIDPPYNTGKDFVYPDNFQDNIKNYLELTGQIEGGAKMQANTESSGRFHTDWLNMMYPRLRLARNLLNRSGAIFVSIDDSELERLRFIMDDIFGEENFVSCLIWKKRVSPANDAKWYSSDHEYLVVYAREKSEWHPKRTERTEDHNQYYKNPDNDPRGAWNSAAYTCNKSSSERPNLYYPITNPNTGEEIWPDKNAVWAYSKETHLEHVKADILYWGSDGKSRSPRKKQYLDEAEPVVPRSIWDYSEVGSTQSATLEMRDLGSGFGYPKPSSLIKKIVYQSTDSTAGDIILDFFAGSGTTGHAVLSQNLSDHGNRRYFLVQLPEPLDISDRDQKVAAEYCLKLGKAQNIAEITKERLNRVAQNIKQGNNLFLPDIGFRVFKLDTSNILPWEPEWDQLEEIVKKSVDHIKEGRTEADILYELLLKLGLDLAVPIEQKAIGQKRVYSIGAGTLIVCLDKRISRSDAEPLALGIVGWHKELAPVGETTCVFLDSGFADDVAKTNLSAILNQHGLANVRSL